MRKYIGIRELSTHLLHVAKENDFDEESLKISGFIKVVFVALAECYKHDVNVNYDILFKKNHYGATRSTIGRLLGNPYDRHVDFELAREHFELTVSDELNEIFIKLISEESNELLSQIPKIINSEVFKNANFEENKTKGIWLRNHLLLPMDIDQIWHLTEILMFAGLSKKEIVNYDLRIPLKKDAYDAVDKYLTMEMNHNPFEENSGLFTVNDIDQLRAISSHTFDSVKIHGAKVGVEDEVY